MKQNSIDSYNQQSSFNEVPSTASSSKKYYSILPDLATGWKPKNFTIPPPIIITFQAPLTQQVIQITKNTQTVLYYGHIYKNSYAFHSKCNHQYIIKYGLNCQQMPLSIQKSLDLISSLKQRPFYGMNPKINFKTQLTFDSNFESGNLDLVLKYKENQYDLFLRPDTNTCGHMQWFYYKVNKPYGYKHKTVKFNICNNRKPKTLYCRGMKPFVLSKFLKSTKSIQWRQQGFNVKYEKFQPRSQWEFGQQNYPQIKQNGWKYSSLSFQYQFQNDQDEIYFAYCPPYSYSDLRIHLLQWKKVASNQSNILFSQEKLCNSLSGLQIPMLTITDQSVPQQDKKNVVAMGRIHPGESNGSHVIKGFIDFLISPSGMSLRKRAIFKIIPMINPDGVVFGNYRTGLAGKDLNRKFKAKNVDLFPQIIHLRDYLLKYKINSKAKFTNFLDFHGHSIKKNVFFYGPQYDIWSTKYQRSKVLPRMLANKTQMFRYQSCVFRVTAFKKTTARAFMLSFVPYCYTIQSSAGLYRSFKHGRDMQFTIQKWQQMGKVVGDTLNESFIKIYQDNFITIKKKRKDIQMNELSTTEKGNLSNTLKEKNFELPDLKEKQKQAQRQKQREARENSAQKKCSSASINNKKSMRSFSSKRYLKSIHNLKKKVGQGQMDFPQIKEEQCESDRYSQGKSDCQSQDNDLSKQKYKMLSGKIMKVIDGFNKIVGGEKQRKSIDRRIKGVNKKKSKKKKRKIQLQEMKLVPSLKHRSIRKNLSEKKITSLDSEENLLRFNRIFV